MLRKFEFVEFKSVFPYLNYQPIQIGKTFFFFLGFILVPKASKKNIGLYAAYLPLEISF